LTFEDPEDRTIFSLLRLRLPRQTSPNPSLLRREIAENIKTSSTPSLVKRGMSESPLTPFYKEVKDQNFPPLQGGIKGGLLKELQDVALVRELHTF
jgi:hypothetical protein